MNIDSAKSPWITTQARVPNKQNLNVTLNVHSLAQFHLHHPNTLSHSSEPTQVIIEAVGGGKGGRWSMGGHRAETVMEGAEERVEWCLRWNSEDDRKVIWRSWLQIKRWEGRMRMMNGWWGRKASKTHSLLSLDMSLSKALNSSTAPVNQQLTKWLLMGSSQGEIVCNCVNMKQCPLPG